MTEPTRLSGVARESIRPESCLTRLDDIDAELAGIRGILARRRLVYGQRPTLTVIRGGVQEEEAPTA